MKVSSRERPYPFQKRAQRRGSVYVAVLGVALIVGVIGLASLQISRIERRAAITANDMAHAQLISQSGIEFALGQLESAGSNWRSTFTHGEEVPLNDWISLGDGQLKFILLDDDSDLTDDSTDLVTIRAIGRSGTATSVTETTYAPAGTGFDCLEAALHSVGELTISGATVDGSGFLSATAGANGTNAATIQLHVETAGFAIGGVYNGPNGGKTEGAPVREMPDPTTVFEYYLVNGTWIDFNNIPSGLIDRVVLTKGTNPFGSGVTNSQGIYVIDCLGNNITIQNSRLEATLVLLNAGSGSMLAGDIHWEPAASNFPAMLVQGNLQFSWLSYQLLSESALSMNFNPVGSPYEGVEDSDLVDTYPGVISGLVYISDSLSISEECEVNGVVVVGGQCSVGSDFHLTHQSLFFSNPPPGFADGSQMRLVPGTWTRTTQ